MASKLGYNEYHGGCAHQEFPSGRRPARV